MCVCVCACVFQAVVNLLNVLSSFPALREAIMKTTPSLHISKCSSVSVRRVVLDDVDMNTRTDLVL